MNKLTAAQFRFTIDFAQWACDQVAGTVSDRELDGAIAAMSRAIVELDEATLARRNVRLEDERDEMMGIIMRRFSEATRRAAWERSPEGIQAAREASARRRARLVELGWVS